MNSKALRNWSLNIYASAPAADAKSLQSCPTLCVPRDGSPPGSHPWDFPGKNTEWVAISFSNAWKVKSESEIAQSCPTLGNPMDSSLPGSSAHGIFQASVLEWGAIDFSDICLYIKIISILQIKLEILWILYPILGPNNPRSLVGGKVQEVDCFTQVHCEKIPLMVSFSFSFFDLYTISLD